MKIFLPLYAILIASLKVFGQATCDFFDDYSDSALWTFYYKDTPIDICEDVSQSGTLEILGGEIVYDDVNDGNDTRFFRDLGFTLDNENWKANFEFTPEEIGTPGDAKVGHIIFAFTSDTNSPFNDSATQCIVNTNDAIMVWYISEYSPLTSTTGLYVYVKNSSYFTSTWGIEWIPLELGTTYFLTLKRISTNYISLEAYYDIDRTDLAGSINCFEISDSITNLHVLQHANLPYGSQFRHLSGSLDNTCIDNGALIPPPLIEGPTSVCEGEAANYIINNADDIIWDLPASISYTIISEDSIVVTDWGAADTVLISAIVNMECVTDTLTQIINVNPEVETFNTYSICENSFIIVFEDTITEAGTYSETLSTILGCDSISNVTIEILEESFTEINATLCNGETYELPDGSLINTPGTYSTTLLSANGCDSTVTTEISENPSYHIIIDTIICAYENFELPDSTVVNESGIYNLYYESSFGCDSSFTITLLVDSCISSEVLAPNAFSPNGDGLNDVFSLILYGNCTLLDMHIFDRWGEEIFVSNSSNTKWDGTYLGKDQETGVYIYFANIECNGEKVFKKGNIILLR